MVLRGIITLFVSEKRKMSFNISLTAVAPLIFPLSKSTSNLLKDI
jgi:hypothetical protein